VFLLARVDDEQALQPKVVERDTYRLRGARRGGVLDFEAPPPLAADEQEVERGRA